MATAKKSRIFSFQLEKMNHEVRFYLIEAGMAVLGELSEKIAEEARRRAVFKHKPEDWPSDPRPSGLRYIKVLPYRRGPDKYDKADSGPIKTTIVSFESEKVPYSYVIMAPAWYSHFLEYGTQEHDMPRKNKLGHWMLFPKDGLVYLAQHVKHPGIRKSPFLRPAAAKADSFAREILTSYGYPVH